MVVIGVKVRAPTKVTLFGEHAVVYGFPALVAAVPIYVTVEAEPSEKLVLESGPIVLNSLEIEIRENRIELGGKASQEVKKYFSYIVSALEELGVNKVKLSVKSELPVGAGMGTSAAVTVATLQAVNKLFSLGLDKKDIHKIAWDVERKVQGKASPMDTAASTYGGLLKVWKEGNEWHLKNLELPSEFEFVVGVFKKMKTTGKIVAEVARKLEGPNGSLYWEIMKTIGKVVEEAEKVITKYDLEKLGELMNLNHALLEALGVVDSQTAYAVRKVIELGGYGAKISGAGHGGALIALVPQDKIQKILSVLEMVGAGKTFVIRGLAKGVE